MSRAEKSPVTKIVLIGDTKARKDLLDTLSTRPDTKKTSLAGTSLSGILAYSHEGREFQIWDLATRGLSLPKDTLAVLVLDGDNFSASKATLERVAREEFWIKHPQKLCIFTLTYPSPAHDKTERDLGRLIEAKAGCPFARQDLYQNEAECADYIATDLHEGRALPARVFAEESKKRSDDDMQHILHSIHEIATHRSSPKAETGVAARGGAVGAATVEAGVAAKSAAAAIAPTSGAGADAAAKIVVAETKVLEAKHPRYEIVLVGSHDSVKATLEQLDRDFGIKRRPEETLDLIRIYSHEGMDLVFSSVSVTPIKEANLVIPLVNISDPLMSDTRTLSAHRTALGAMPKDKKIPLCIGTAADLKSAKDSAVENPNLGALEKLAGTALSAALPIGGHTSMGRDLLHKVEVALSSAEAEKKAGRDSKPKL